MPRYSTVAPENRITSAQRLTSWITKSAKACGSIVTGRERMCGSMSGATATVRAHASRGSQPSYSPVQPCGTIAPMRSAHLRARPWCPNRTTDTTRPATPGPDRDRRQPWTMALSVADATTP